MKRKFTKFITSILIVLLLINFIGSTNSYVIATDDVYNQFATNPATQEETDLLSGKTPQSEGGWNVVNWIWDGIVGVITGLINIVIVTPGILFNGLSSSLGWMAGMDVPEGSNNNWVTLYHVFFNRLAITDINILELKWGASVDKDFQDDSFKILRENIASWYYGIRNLALIILLCVLIYVGIRMAISTVAEEQAKYKTMLKDWFVALVLIFTLQYIVIITTNINNVLISALDPGVDTQTGDYQGFLLSRAFTSGSNFWQGLGSGVVYTLLAGATFSFIIMYIKRMITIAFLTLIAPIITITYPIDKMGDGKSQALNSWLKEFIFNVLIQPFHCILYLVFVTSAIELLNGTLAGGIFAVITILFIYQAETIIKKIFGFGDATTLGDAVKSVAASVGVMSLASKLTGRGKGVKNGNQENTGNTNTTPSNQANNNQNAANAAGNQTTSTNTASTKKRTFARNVARSALRGYGKVAKAGFGIGSAALIAGAGGNATQVLSGFAVGNAIAGSTGRFVRNLPQNISEKRASIRQMAADDSEVKFNKVIDKIKSDPTILDGERYTEDLVKNILKNENDFTGSLQGVERKLAQKTQIFEQSLAKIGDASPQDTILNMVRNG